MGLRLYVAKTYKVEFAYGIAFNYMVSEFHNLLDALDVSYSGETWDDRFDVEKDEWLKGIEVLKNLHNLSINLIPAYPAIHMTMIVSNQILIIIFNSVNQMEIIMTVNLAKYDVTLL